MHPLDSAAIPGLPPASCQARALHLLQQLGYTLLPPAALAAERDSRREVLLVDRLVAALRRLNPGLSEANVHRALRELTGPPAADLAAARQRTHALLTSGTVVEQNGGARRPRTVRYLDLQRPADNDLVVTWQLPVRGVQRQVVLDLVVFVNGIPLAVLMCEPATTADATDVADPAWLRTTLAALWRWQEPERATHELGVPRLFETTHLLVALGAQTAVYGTVLLPPHEFTGWPSAWPRTPAQVAALTGRPPTAPDLLLGGLLAPPNLLDLLQNFVAFPRDLVIGHTATTLSRCSEFLAVQRAVAHVQCDAPDGARPAGGGIIWHALGSGGARQHLMMAWLVRKLRPELQEPTRALILVAEDASRGQTLGDAVRAVGLGPVEAPDSLASLQRLLAVPATPAVLMTARDLFAALTEAPWGLLAGPAPVVLIAEVLGSHAAGLVPLLRQALPDATIFGFTSTPPSEQDAQGYVPPRPLAGEGRGEGLFDGNVPSPSLSRKRARSRSALLPRAANAVLSAQDPQARTTRGRYISSYSFAEAIADAAAVPVYFVPRPLALPPGRSGAAERALVLCRDLREHFLRVIRPGGGRAQLLVGSPAAARLYRQTLDRLGDRGPEISVSCQAPASDESSPLWQAVYVDTPLGGRALLQAVLSVNAPAPGKLFALVIDYAATDSGLAAALQEFAAADIADALRRPADELPQLPAGHQAALTQLAAAKNLYSLEQCITALESPARRREFQRAFVQWAHALELLLDTPQAQGFVAEVRWLGQVLLAAGARYRDGQLTLTDCGPLVQQLITAAVAEDGNQALVTRAELLTHTLDEKLAALPTLAAKISELSHALEHELALRWSADPAFFTTLRDQLSQLRQQQQSQQVQPELVLTQLLGLRASLASRLGRSAPVGLSKTAAAAYAVLTGVEAPVAADAQLRYGVPIDSLNSALAIQIDALITAQLANPAQGPGPHSQAALLDTVASHLAAAGISAERARVLAARIVERLSLRGP